MHPRPIYKSRLSTRKFDIPTQLSTREKTIRGLANRAFELFPNTTLFDAEVLRIAESALVAAGEIPPLSGAAS